MKLIPRHGRMPVKVEYTYGPFFVELDGRKPLVVEDAFITSVEGLLDRSCMRYVVGTWKKLQEAERVVVQVEDGRRFVMKDRHSTKPTPYEET